MKFKKFIVLYIPYVLLINIIFAQTLSGWKLDMKLWVAIYISTMNLPVVLWLGYFLYKKFIKKPEVANEA